MSLSFEQITEQDTSFTIERIHAASNGQTPNNEFLVGGNSDGAEILLLFQENGEILLEYTTEGNDIMLDLKA